MIKVENIETWGFEHAIRGARNPMNSWARSDSLFDGKNILNEQVIEKGTLLSGIGKKDMELMQKLYKAGTEHRKYLRQIFVSMDTVAPLYWWKEADQYRIGVTTNSCSTMHKIAAKEFELNDFSHEHLYTDRLSAYCPQKMLEQTIKALNFWRYRYLTTNNKSDWWQLIQLLPSSYNQKRTITMNYENVFNIIHQRSGHKLKEWRDFVEILKDLPYVREIMGEKPPEDEQLPGQITIDEYMEGKG